MSETRKLVAILAAAVVGYSRLAGADEDHPLARLHGLRSDCSFAAARQTFEQRLRLGNLRHLRRRRKAL